MIDGDKKNIAGVLINAVDYASAVTAILHNAHARRRYMVTALAVHGLVTGAMDRQHRFRLNNFDLAVPDGQPVRWALNLLYGTRLKDRVYGPKLTLLVCMEAAHARVPVFFYGSTQTVLTQLCARMRRFCPGLIIAGMQASAFRGLSCAEREAIVQQIKQSGAQIVFAGLGCPRQEVFAYEMSAQLELPVLAVGAAFDYHAGTLREPPDLIQRMGLQWLYRLIREPRRLWRRYLVTNSQFMLLFLLQFLRLRVPDPADCDAPSQELLYG